MEQLSIPFPRTRKGDPRTSRKAANKIKSGSVRDGILRTIHVHGAGATFEIAQLLDKDRDSISPHMKPLAQMDYIQRSGSTTPNPKTGNECEVWELTDKGREYCER